jgi:hypothetical protein
MSIGKLIRKGLSFSNVVTAGTATANITPGRTLEGIYLLMSSTLTSSAMISLVRMKVNGKTVIEGTGAQLDKIAKFNGLTYPATVLPIMFIELLGRDFVDQMAGAFDTSKGIDSITLEVTTAAAGATPGLELYLLESPPQAGGVSELMAKVLRYPFNVSSGGQLPINLPFGPNNGAIVKRIHIESTNNLMTAVTVKENAVVVHESVKAINDAHNQFFRSTSQSNTYSVDCMPDENIRNCMDTRSDRSLELLVTFSGADNGNVIVEYLDKLGNL